MNQTKDIIIESTIMDHHLLNVVHIDQTRVKLLCHIFCDYLKSFIFASTKMNKV